MRKLKKKIICYINIVTYNSAATIAICLQSVRALQLPPNIVIKLHLTDNDSSDDTLSCIETSGAIETTLRHNDNNQCFCSAHNDAITVALADGADYVLVLNPDVRLEDTSLIHLIEALHNDHLAGIACPKLYRADSQLAPITPPTLDACGMFITPATRHFDRGSQQLDAQHFNVPRYVFGASGAAILLKRAFIEDVAFREISGVTRYELFDDAFFAYREDADLAWRAQYLGWRCRFVPQAIGYHERRVLPERRSTLPAELNRLGVRNRFLLQLNNFSLTGNLHCLLPTLIRNLTVIAGVFIVERSSLTALRDVIALTPRALAHRTALFRRRRTSPVSVGRWFSSIEVTEPALDFTKAPQAIRRIRAVVVNYNSGLHLNNCLESLEQLISKLPSRLKFEVVIVDNNSSDDSISLVTPIVERNSNFTLHCLERNLGFAGAINWAVSRADSDAILILNPDTLLDASALTELVKALNSNGILGAVAPILVNFDDGEPQLGFTARRFPTLGSTFAELFYLHRVWPDNPWTADYQYRADAVFLNFIKGHTTPPPIPAADINQPLLVDQPAGACVLIRINALKAVDGLDEAFYPAWFEDVDLFRRLAKKGILSALVASARVKHKGGYSFDTLTKAKFVSIWQPNLLRYWEKHGSQGEIYALNTILPLALALRSLVSVSAGLRSFILGRKQEQLEFAQCARVYLKLAAKAAGRLLMNLISDIQSLIKTIIDSTAKVLQ